jgi:hypothetical protein
MKARLNLKAVLIRGHVELVEGKVARLRVNQSIHLKYVTQDAPFDPCVASYLSKGDDVTVKVNMECLICWNLSGTLRAAQVFGVGGWFSPLDDDGEGELEDAFTMTSLFLLSLPLRHPY